MIEENNININKNSINISNKINDNSQNFNLSNEIYKPILEKKNIDNNFFELVSVDNNENKDNISSSSSSSEEDKQNEKKIEKKIQNSIPSLIIGDVLKNGEVFGFLNKFNHRYLALNTKKGLLYRFKSYNEYPYNPLEIIPIANISSLKRLAKNIKNDFYEFEIIFKIIDKNNNNIIKKHIYRVRHLDSLNQWFNSIQLMWNSLKKDIPINILSKKIIFVDDHAGIIQDIIKENNNRVNITINNFKLISVLGKGGFSTVYKAYERNNPNKIYALKVMNKNSIINQKYLHYIMSEFDIMKKLGNFPFILNLYYCFQSANYLYMAIDYCNNGDFNDVNQIKNMKIMFAELILAFEYMHKKGIIYRDLKPENILLDSDGHIKLCDFNLAKKDMNSITKRAYSFCGSPLYLSPEMLEKNGVTLKSDIYQIGLVFYQLFSNQIPFSNARNMIELYDMIKKNKIDFECLNEDIKLKDLIKKMVQKNSYERIYIDEIKKHDYFKDINWDDVLNKKCGSIEVIRNNNIINDTINKNNIKVSEENFDQYEENLNKNKKFTYIDGKISVKEMKKDLKRQMKNYVREFYYINKN